MAARKQVGRHWVGGGGVGENGKGYGNCDCALSKTSSAFNN